MPPTLNEPCIVYWVHYAAHRSVKKQGYVGITGDPARNGDHRRKWPRATFKVLFIGTRRQCLVIEYSYRPERHIGWNRQRGGGRMRRQLSQT